MPKFFDEFVPQLVQRVRKSNPAAADILRDVVAIGSPVWKHPTAIYFGGINWTGPQPQPKLAILCDAGADAPDLSKRIDSLLQQAAKDNTNGPMPSVKTYGSLVVLAFGTPASIDAQFQNPPLDCLSKATKFVATLAQVQPDPAFIEYVDCPGIVKLVDDSLQQMKDAKVIARWTQIRDSLGISGLHEVITTAGFDGKDWQSQAFIGASEANTGILALLHGAPISQDLLKAIPQTADRASAGRLDLDSLLGHIRDVVAQIDPETGDQFDQGLANINQMAGLDIRKDFLAALGDEWATYSDRGVAGPGFLGTVVVNRLRDADTAEKSIDQLTQRINMILAQAIGQPEIKIEFHQQVIDGLTVHYLAIPLVTPSWAISDGNLYLGLYPQVVTAAADQVKNHAPSILDRTEYQTVMKRLGDHPAGAVEFCNLPVTAVDSYTDSLMISRLYTGFADIFGVHPPVMMVPPLKKLLPELSPSGGITWTDAQGMHAKSISPFPGADLVAGASMSNAIVGEEAMMVSILLPSLNKARETANRAKCASNMHQIGLAILLYQNDNNQKYPDDLGTLTKTEQITAQCFLCPSGSTALPANFGTMTPDDIAKWVNDNSDYVYLGKGLKGDKAGANFIILYEKDGAHGGEGMNMLFGDGHAEWFQMDRAKKMIADQQGGM
jgi:prepilin-type processing-associated H-X9-DG protein